MALTSYENSLEHLAKSISDEIGEEIMGRHQACWLSNRKGLPLVKRHLLGDQETEI